MFEIYTTGGGDYLVTTLNAVAAFFNTGNAGAMVGIGLMVGMFVLVFQIMLGGDMAMALKTYLMVGLVGALSVADRSDVIIFDSTKGPLWFQTVDNVPTSVAYIGSATSSVSNALTRQFEALFTPPTNVAYQRHGMLFGATLMTKSARWRAVTSVVHENLTNFMDQCVIDAVDLRYIDPDVYTRSGNLEATIAGNMPASLAYYDTQTRSTRACSDGWPDIVTAMNAEVDVVIAAQAASTFQGADAAAAISDIENTISDFAAFAGYASVAAEDHIKQAMLIAAFDDAANRGISATGNAAALQHLQSARAEVQTRSSYQAIGSNALSWVPYLKIVFENLYYGAFPLALALMMTPLCLQVIRGYFGGFVWLASWEPLSAILHSLMMNASVERFQTITSASTSGAYTQSVMNWANHFGVYSIGQDVSAMAGYLMMSIPFVASALFWGTRQMTGLATSMLAVSQSAAAETGREMATGNLAYNNTTVGNRSFRNINMDNYARNNASYDNVSANRTVTSPFTDVGRNSAYGADGSLITTNRDGTTGIDGGSSRVNTAASLSLGNSLVSSLRTSAGNMMERGAGARRTYERTHGRMSSRTSSFMQAVQTGDAFSSGRGLSASAEERASLSESVATLDRFAEENGISRRTALEVGLHASAGTPSWLGLSAGARSSLSRQGVTQKSFNAISQASRTESIDNAISDLSRASQEYSASSSGSNTTAADKGFRDSVEELERQANSAETFERSASNYSEVADRVQNNTVNISDDMNGGFADWLLSQRGDRNKSPAQVGELLNNRGTPAELRTKREELNALRAEYADSLVDSFVDPLIDPSYSRPLVAPNDPGKPLEQLGDVFNPMGTVLKDYARDSLDTETTILSGSTAIPGTALGGSEVRSSATGRVNTNEQARSRQITGGVTGLGGLGAQSEWRPSASISSSGRDAVIRTVIGEAAREGETGWAAVAHVVRNRVEDPRFDNNARDVVLSPKQFSAWNDGAGGNDLVNRYGPASQLYQQVGQVVDQVWSGDIPDVTGGATHYYSPRGMDALVSAGHQSNIEPRWLDEQNRERGVPPVEIGGHIFTGRRK